MSDKNLFKGSFNNSGEMIILYTHASTIKQAYNNFIHQLIDVLKLDKEEGKRKLRNYYSGRKANYEIKEED